MPKRSHSVRRSVGFCVLLAVMAYTSAAAYHFYYLLHWKTDISAGDADLRGGHYDAAISSLQEALRLSPRLGHQNYIHADAWTHEHLGEAYRKKGEFDHAAAEYRAAIAIDGRPSSRDGLRRTFLRDQS